MVKVMLVTPDYHSGVVESAGRWPHIGFVYIAGELRKRGFDVIIYDAMSKGHDLVRITEEIKKIKPDVVATTAFTASMPAAAELLYRAKKCHPAVVTVIGGIHPTFLYEEVLNGHPFIDYVVRYEGEYTMPELLEAHFGQRPLAEVKGIAYRLNGQVVVTELRPYIEDLDTLVPAWDLLDWEDYTFYVYPGSRLGIISTSRGCQHDCGFCSQHKFWQRTWRARSVESVTSEIEHLVKEYGVEIFFISDEYPTADRERWEKILDWLIDKQLGAMFLIETRVDDIIRDEDIMHKYRQAGIIHIYVGIEATSQENLDIFNKGIVADDSKRALDIIHAHGIVSETSFVLGIPQETKASIKRTLETAIRYNPDFAHFLLLAPWPYADMYKDLKQYIVTADYARYNLVEPVIKPARMTTDELFMQVLKCYQKFYFGKIAEWATLKDGFKKRYAIQSMKAIMENSFLKEHVLKLGSIPKSVEKLLKTWVS
ncbi:radical SAM protein [Thermincola ferriacetica]|uniref:Radical SAM protein n=1 Tax=Thermincola ferriacetica TaxID=281456 RepID=A0A0L6W4S2_9FIRM|nr:cobalamin-dependent protein [Thermincola ferriacetica]KNZ70525.1 radical SAM protein [Thermincola ferriacetica]